MKMVSLLLSYWAILIKKVIAYSKDNGYSLIAIHNQRRLAQWRIGEVSWTLIDNGRVNSYFHDAIYFTEEFYIVDKEGRVVLTNAKSLEATTFSSPVISSKAILMHLVESLGDLFFVDIQNKPLLFGSILHVPVCFSIFNLNKKQMWELVSDIGDQVFFLGGRITFSLSSAKFLRLKGN